MTRFTFSICPNGPSSPNLDPSRHHSPIGCMAPSDPIWEGWYKLQDHMQDDVYVFLDHLQMKLCHDFSNGIPKVVGIPGCSTKVRVKPCNYNKWPLTGRNPFL